MFRLSTIYDLVSVILTTVINVSFEAFFVMGLVYAVNLNTGIYKNLSDLSKEFGDFRKVFWNSLESDVSKINKTKELEEEIRILKIKLAKLKKLYLVSNDVIEKLDERLRNIEDELDEEYNEDDSGSSSSEEENDSSYEDKKKKKNK